MVGEFLREAAVLLVIFVPLEFWKAQNGVVNTGLLWHVGEGTVILFVLGVVAEYASIGAIRIKRDLEGNINGSN
jgi:hypothetical protein